MKLSLYAFMFGITVSSLSYGMDESNAAKPAAQTQKKDDTQKAANTMTSQEVCRLTLCAIALKQLGAPKQ